MIVAASKPVIQINGFTNNEWYRKPKGSRKGPWLQAEVEVLDQNLWNKRVPCLYFLANSKGELKYVGISVNRIKDRWRSSPAYDAADNPLQRNEMFHSQCWPHMCNLKKSGVDEKYVVSVIHDSELVHVLGGLDHEVSALSAMRSDPDIAVIAMEVWFIKHLGHQLWNQRK
ncbi:GIY-YIG nuclease family protein [Neptunomonas marina]|uniref:GIY-YIG nuclease family protein n=1 Tax=Neptunomonas marina TaxID=1815562 RepID=A0A437Q8P8_9GAMM|nr:GIY-YIG nuclease family protein [Neptunomonas marina]RVU30951.1 GIY-YIG nuclease family protein [Neptunomonas marina]